MFRGRSRGRRRGRGGYGSVQKVPLKGLFSKGVWHCNCDPRLPAQRLQTKKGNENHGRWFYTCQNPQPTRCDFFLWEDNAKLREEAAVLNNSRTEPTSTPQTPVKPSTGGLSTPKSSAAHQPHGSTMPQFSNAYTPSKISFTSRSFTEGRFQDGPGTPKSHDSEPEEFYDWLSSDDDELSKVAESTPTKLMPPPATPRKAQKTTLSATPSKRRHNETIPDDAPPWPTPTSTSQAPDIFTTPPTNPPSFPNLFSPPFSSPLTPTPNRPNNNPNPNTNTNTTASTTDLTTSILLELENHHVPLAPAALHAIKTITTKHALFTLGVLKGRDVSRASIAAKNERIVELQGVITDLQAEREMNRAVIRHLRREARGEGEGGEDEGGE